MPKVSEAHKAAVRERLVRAGLECVEEKGYEGTSIRDILAKAELSAGAFYHYFKGKEELIAAIGDSIADLEINVATTNADVRAGGANSAGELLAMLAAGAMDPQAFRSLLPSARTQAAHVPAIREGLKRYDHRIVGTVKLIGDAAQADGDLRPEIDTEALIELAVLVFEGIQSKAQSNTFVTSSDRLGKTFQRLLALGAAPDGSKYREALLARLKT